MLAGADLGWPSNTRPLHDIVANQFEWRRHCQPAVLVPFGLLARPVTDRGLTPVMGLVWLRYSAASSPAARVELVRAAGVRMRREGCPPMGPLDCKYSGGGLALMVPMGLACRMRLGCAAAGWRPVRMGPAASREWAKGRRGALQLGVGLPLCTLHPQQAKATKPRPVRWWPGPWPMPDINGHGPELACPHALGCIRTGQGAKGARGLCWPGRVLLMEE